MVALEDVYDADKVESEISKLETRADAFIKAELYDGSDQVCIFKPGKPIREGIANAFVNRYKENGWEVRWDGDMNNPWFYFSFPKLKYVAPKTKRQRRWWLLWLA